MRKLILVIFLCVFYAISPALVAQEEEVVAVVQDTTYTDPREVLRYDEETITPLSLNEETIEGFKNDAEFDYSEALPDDNWWTRLKTWFSNLWSTFLNWILGGEEAVGFWAILIELLPYIGIAILIGLIVWIFLKIDSGTLLNERIKAPGVLLSDDEELIKNQDLQTLIDQALDDTNYRLAVRFYYLLILQKLSSKELIDWQVQKTNHEYLFEIEDATLRDQFRQVTDLYDYIWYGNFEVDSSAFAKAETPLKTLKNTL